MKKVILIFVLAWIAVSFLHADLYMKSVKRSVTTEPNGKPKPEIMRIEEQWLAKDRFALINDELSLIFNLNEKELLVLVHPLKQYYRIPTNVKMADLKKWLPLRVFASLQSLKISAVNVSPDVETKKIADWNCRASDLDMTVQVPALSMNARVKLKMWMTDDIPFDYEQYTGVVGRFFMELVKGFVKIDDGIMAELEKLDAIKGIQVASEADISLLGIKMTENSRCLELEEKAAPPGTYSIPEGYREMKFPTPTAGTPKKSPGIWLIVIFVAALAAVLYGLVRMTGQPKD